MEKYKNIIISIGVALAIIAIAYFSFSSNNTSNYADTLKASLNSNLSVPVKESSSHTPSYIYVKYRTGKVDIAHPRWEYLNTSKSSFVRGAWYDDDNQYMVINLSGTNYHYCGMPKSVWNSFKKASSFGTYYNNYIKGSYDCRKYPVPSYEEDKSSSTEFPSIGSLATVPSSGGSYRSYSNDVYLYDANSCRERSYCYGEDQYGNEIEIYVYDLRNGYGYGEDSEGNEVEFYFDYPRTIDDVYLYDTYGCEEGNYCYGEDEYGNEVEVYIYEMDDGYGYGEDDDGNEVEFYYDE